MNRREVLKGLGLSIGTLLVTPTALSLLQSCAKEEKISWVPKFFTVEEVPLLNTIVDVILPKTEDSPSATEVNVPQFIDRYVAEVYEEKDQKLYRKGFESIVNIFKGTKESINFFNVKEAEVEDVLAKVLKKTEEEHNGIMQRFFAAVESKSDVDSEDLKYVTLDGIRNLSVFAYKNTERVGEEVLNYDPVPGKQKGCIDIDSSTKAYSL
ncbi:Gluconate 2-dehydrogenase subunit 3 [Tenacibaculum sp. MAR_2009_124]|uniref:gluconate 2-dehydrogenase subunit 3 family protein n=1 Tax=Tenacibaculum sp. MAR_2009_124 TaxID=1250059 RepID=UPI00089BB8FB|nr:gluconate 2-dehydrogenase subunit 3 family protein [Tenacibaculum sp. MAR_2009_124]SEB36358.1 Gluconate 2-dehydrogenase subunit 3 [Tenacibaculum sp. MAR_2009_124]